MTIYEYEIELKLTQKTTGVSQLERVTEHAYSAVEAAMQAIVNHNMAGTMDVLVVRIGPPQRLIEAYAVQTEELVNKVIQKTHEVLDGIKTHRPVKLKRQL